MRSVLLSALLAALVWAPAAPAHTVVQSDTARDPRLAGTGLVWAEGSTIVRRRAGGRVSRIVLPPGSTSIVAASATHVLVQRAMQRCEPAPDAVETCRTLLGMWAGPLDGPIGPLTPQPGCRAGAFGPAAALEGSVAVLTEYRRCGVRRRNAIVRFDLATGARRTLARFDGTPHSVRAAGRWIAWSLASGYRSEMVLWRAGRVRKRIRADRLGAHTTTWDLQADGTLGLVQSVPDGPADGLFTFRPGDRAPRPTGARVLSPSSLHLARDRIATFDVRGRLRIIDLGGRRRDLPRAHPPRFALTDFDGRRGVWIRDKVLDPGVNCPFSWPPDDDLPPCEATGARIRHWIVRDRIAR